MSGEIDAWVNDIHCGDVRETLSEMSESSVHCIVTSPPYYGLRDYGEDGQIGLEESLDEYITELVAVGKELRRVLRDDGSWWLNLGDSFAGSGRGQWTDDGGAPKESYSPDSGQLPDRETPLRRKSKMLIPHRVVIALQDAGWIVRSDAVWAKQNPMPHPVKDRLNEHKEFVFHLTPQPDYWFDLDAIREPHSESSFQRIEAAKESGKYTAGLQMLACPGEDDPEDVLMDPDDACHPNGKNPGDIFEVTVQAFPDAHFAVYPPELVETPIKATCPPEVCAECGTPYERVTEDGDIRANPHDRPQKKRALEIADDVGLTDAHLEACRKVGVHDADYSNHAHDGGFDKVAEETATLAREAKAELGGYFREFMSVPSENGGLRQTCDCDTTATDPGIVLDPFAGAGTTCLVGKRLGRRFVGIDLNPEYVAMAQKRVGITVDEPERLLEDGETALTAFGNGGDGA